MVNRFLFSKVTRADFMFQFEIAAVVLFCNVTKASYWKLRLQLPQQSCSSCSHAFVLHT